MLPKINVSVFCLKLNSRHSIGTREFKERKWLPTRKGTSPFYINEQFVPSRNVYKTRSHMALEIPLRKSNLGQKSILFMGPSVLNKLTKDLKILNTATLFTHNYYKHLNE